MSDMSPYAYTAFGLEISSDLALPELAPGGGRQADLEIRRVPGAQTRDEDRPVWCRFREEAENGTETDTLSWDEVGRFDVLGSDAITYAPADAASEALVSLPLLGPVMAVLLHRRGLLTLHGSAVAIDGRGSVFLGDKGAGKSTTAAALIRAGHPLVTDDIVALDIVDGQTARIWPGYPQVKLTDDAREALPLAGSEEMPSPHPEFGKHRQRLPGRFDVGSVPLAEAVVLQRGDAFQMEALTGLEAVKALMRFSYVTRFGDRIVRGAAQALHLQQCVAVSKTASVFRLTVPHDLARLDQVVETIREARAARAAAVGATP